MKYPYKVLALASSIVYLLPVHAVVTLNDFDPTPHYTAASTYMPPGSHMLYERKEDIRHTREEPTHHYVGFSFSPYGQKSVKATDSKGNLFGEKNSKPQANYQKSMGNFRGTPFLLGLFLGNDTEGKNIWDSNTVRTKPGQLKADLDGTAWKKDTTYDNVFKAIKNSTYPDGNTSIFSENALDDDPYYFTGINLPTTYQRVGARAQLHFDISKYIGATLQGGFASISHKIERLQTLTQSADDGYTNIYTSSVLTGKDAITNNVDNNIEQLVKQAGYSLDSFQEVHQEDIHAALYFRYPRDIDEPNTIYNEWQSLIFTPYAIIEGTAAVGTKKDHSKLLSLPFGNNGHHAVGGRLGGTFDFRETIEVGADIGLMHFFEETVENMPCPTHRLQRHLYPFKTNVKVQPGLTWSVRAGMNAFEFIDHVNFAFMYEYVHHSKDKHTLVKSNKNFMPHLLDNNTAWNAHMFSAAFDFKVHPDISFGIAWNGSIKQQNARGVHTLLGSITWLF